MSDHDESTNPEIENLDPQKAQDVTESGELERPPLRRKIDCAGNPEVSDRRQLHSRGAPAGRQQR
jgi:hypothetical protein